MAMFWKFSQLFYFPNQSDISRGRFQTNNNIGKAEAPHLCFPQQVWCLTISGCEACGWRETRHRQDRRASCTRREQRQRLWLRQNLWPRPRQLLGWIGLSKYVLKTLWFFYSNPNSRPNLTSGIHPQTFLKTFCGFSSRLNLLKGD